MDGVKQEVNVEKIMEEIRDQIRREEGMSDIPAFEDIPLRGEAPTVPAERRRIVRRRKKRKTGHFSSNPYNI